MKLRARSARGKQLIKDYGDEWKITHTSPVQFARGLHWFITPANEGVSHTRWMHPKGDKHLEVVEDTEELNNILNNQPGMGR